MNVYRRFVPATMREAIVMLLNAPATLREAIVALQNVPATLREAIVALQYVPASLREAIVTLQYAPASVRGAIVALQNVPASVREAIASLQYVPASVRGHIDRRRASLFMVRQSLHIVHGELFVPVVPVDAAVLTGAGGAGAAATVLQASVAAGGRDVAAGEDVALVL